jgi:hypothetical protein
MHLGCAENDYPKESPNTNVKEEIPRYSSQYSARLSERPNDLVVNLMAQPDNNKRFEDT